MLTLTAISGAAVVSTIRQRPCQRRCARHDGLVLLTEQQQVLGQGAGRRCSV
jgi:hypothetical protein